MHAPRSAARMVRRHPVKRLVGTVFVSPGKTRKGVLKIVAKRVVTGLVLAERPRPGALKIAQGSLALPIALDGSVEVMVVMAHAATVGKMSSARRASVPPASASRLARAKSAEVMDVAAAAVPAIWTIKSARMASASAPGRFARKSAVLAERSAPPMVSAAYPNAAARNAAVMVVVGNVVNALKEQCATMANALT